MRGVTSVAAISLILVIIAHGLSAHHPFTAEFDANNLKSFTGTVTRIEWTNPHAHFYVDVKEEDGTANWNFELGPLLVLRRLGWRQDSLRIGERVTVVGYLAKSGAKKANAKSVMLSDGRKVFAGSSVDKSSTAPVER